MRYLGRSLARYLGRSPMLLAQVRGPCYHLRIDTGNLSGVPFPRAAWPQEVDVFPYRRLFLVALAGFMIAGCAVVQRAERPDGPFEIAILAVSDTRGELEPCG
jgi:hypothetical protein